MFSYVYHRMRTTDTHAIIIHYSHGTFDNVLLMHYLSEANGLWSTTKLLPSAEALCVAAHQALVRFSELGAQHRLSF